MSRQLDIFSDIGAEEWMSWYGLVTPGTVRDFLAEAGSEDVEIRFNSAGGSVTAGFAIASMIRAHKGKTTAVVLGVAASMAGVVACSCDELEMGAGSYLMVHNPWASVSGDAEGLRHDAALLDKFRESMIDIYQTKFRAKSRSELRALMDAETWLAASDCMEMGAIRGVREPVQAAACATGCKLRRMPADAAALLRYDERMSIMEGIKPVAAAEATPADPDETAEPVAGQGADDPGATPETPDGTQTADTPDDPGATPETPDGTQTAEARLAEASAALAEANRRCDELRSRLEETARAHKARVDELESRIARLAVGAAGGPVGDAPTVRTFRDAVEKYGYAKARKLFPESFREFKNRSAR